MRFLILLLSFAFISSPAFAAQDCYTKREAAAEQGIRIHSELMVIGLNCQHIATSNGQNLYLAYRSFANKHADVFKQYDDIMIQRLGSEEALHSMRTDFSNKISGDAARMRPDKFCARYSPRIAAVSTMSDETLKRWAETPYEGYPPTKPICASAEKHIASR